MRVLLVRPDPGNERFGLGPFFRVEPLGLEYIAQALVETDHEPTIVDLRFGRGLSHWLRQTRPRIVGISCTHALEYDQVVACARVVRQKAPEAFVVVGGHAAAAFSTPLEVDAVDAICVDDGEEVFPALVQAIEEGTDPSTVPGLRVRTAEGFSRANPRMERTCLDSVPIPARGLVARYRDRYHCLLFKPVWLIETARGCPFRCNFCSVWQLYDRSFRERSIEAVVEDFCLSGPHVFVADDLFWHRPARSFELARALRRRGVRKRWILVQSRCDLVAKHADLLEAWRPLAEDFDIFLGMEAVSDRGLVSLNKDAGIHESIAAIETARALRYGVVTNFLVDPDWGEAEFEELWEFVATHRLSRSGFTLLTPLPGTELYERMAPRLAGQPWSKFDMHHLLWEPPLGARRFFELYAETWKRSVLNLSGPKGLGDWAKQVRLAQLPFLTRVLLQTQRLMRADAYMREHETFGQG